MTVPSDLARVEYSGNSTTTVFSTGFAFLSNLDVKVILTDAAGVETTQVENVNYTLTGATHADDPPTAGTLTMMVAPPTGTLLVIMRDVQFIQDLDGTTLSTMDAGDQEEAYDKIWHALAQLKEGMNRALRATDGSPDPVPGTWVPLLAIEVDGARCVLRVTGWTGGPAGSTPPDSGMYVGPVSYVATAAEATDIRGSQGPAGPDGQAGPQGPQGIPGPVGPAGSGAGDMLRSQNLNDVLDKPTSRSNLGLGNSATRNVGTTAGTVAAGDDSRFGAGGTAVGTSFTPAGNIAATNVQAALQEVDTEKAAITYVDAQDATLNTIKAPIASPTFTGDPKAPTPAPGDNDTSIATTAFVAAAIAAAPPSSALPLSRQVSAIINQNMTTCLQGFFSGSTTIVVMKDGTVRSAGYPNGTTGTNQSLGKGVAGNAATTVDLRKVSLPSGLLGTPVAVYHNGGCSFILTDQGDVCGAGRNNNGDLGVGDTTAREIFTLLNATNIGPRSAGGASRKVVDIIVSVNSYNPQTPNNAPTWFRCADNTLWACGINTGNQLGVGDAVSKNTPTQCQKNDGAGNVAIADCAKVYAWGNDLNSVGYIDTSGKLRLAGRLQSGAAGRNTGTGAQNVFRPVFTTTDNAASELPPAYVALELAVSIGETICVRCADKCLYAWGVNSQGQCGIANTTQQNNPKKVGGGTGVATAFNGNVERLFSCAAHNSGGNFLCQMTDGTIYCWGFKSSGDLPIASADGNISTPVAAQSPINGAMPVITRIFGNTVAGTGPSAQTLFMWLADGRIFAWGPSGLDGTTQAYFTSSVPRQVSVPARPGSPTIVAAGCGGDSSGGDNSVVWLVLSDGYMLVMGEGSPPDAIGGTSYSFNEASVPP